MDEVVLLVKTAVQADQSLCEEKIMMELGIMEKDEKGKIFVWIFLLVCSEKFFFLLNSYFVLEKIFFQVASTSLPLYTMSRSFRDYFVL